MWPSAVVLSHWIASNPQQVNNKQVLELGAGCGLVGLFTACLQQSMSRSMPLDACRNQSVILSDFNETVLENITRNISLNAVNGIAKAISLDFYQQTGDRDGWIDMTGEIHECVDVVLGADIICQASDAYAAARTIHDSLKVGGQAFIVCGDSEHRFGVEKFEEACRLHRLEVSMENVKNLYDGRLMSACIEKTTGYVENMTLKLFVVHKSV